MMTEAGRSAILVRTPRGLGIVTDSDLRARVVARGLSVAEPVGDAMTFPVRTVREDRFASEVLLEMLETGIHHLPIVDVAGRVVGVISDLDVLGLERRDPFEMRAQIFRAPDPEAVAEIGRRLPTSVALLAGAGLAPEDVGHVVAAIVDALTARLAEIAVEELGPPPAPWAWLALGSEGRREQALGTDQDHALAHAASDEGSDAYFLALAERVSAGLDASGIARCPSRVSATEAALRQSLDGWVRTFEGWMSAHEAKPVFLATIAFDLRQVAGPLDAETPLNEVAQTAKDRPEFLWRLARLAAEIRPPLGFRGKLILDRGQDGRRTLDVKGSGILPVVDLARFFALRSGIVAKGTVDRLRGAAEAGTVDRDTSEALEEAYRALLDIRLAHQAAQVDAGAPPDNLVEPSALGRIERGRLRDALRLVDQAQRELARRLSSGGRMGPGSATPA
jgi:CBS domain-containing protein